jgi:hypothetical protein
MPRVALWLMDTDLGGSERRGCGYYLVFGSVAGVGAGLAGRVQTLGVGTSSSAVAITDMDLTAESYLRPPGGYQLTWEINQPPVSVGLSPVGAAG